MPPEQVPASPVPPPAPDPVSKLPGSTALTKLGIAIYKERVGFFVGIGCIQIALGFVLLAVFGMLIIAGALLLASALLHAALGTGGLYIIAGIGIAVVALVMVLFGWVSCWVALALLHVIRAREGHVSFSEAFKQARPQAWPMVWIGLLALCSYFGALALFGALPGALIYFGLGGGATGAVIAGIVGFLALVGVTIAFSTWFSFAAWVLIDMNARGMSALLISKGMVRGSFWPIWRRAAVIGVYAALASMAVSIVVGILSFAVPDIARSAASAFLRQGVMTLVVYPIMIAAIFSLYSAVKARAVPVDASNGRGKMVALAIIGLIALVGLPFAAIVAVPAIIHSYTASHQTRAVTGYPYGDVPGLASSTAASSAADDAMNKPGLAVIGASTTSVGVFYYHMPSASVSIVRDADGKTVWLDELGGGEGTRTITPDAGILVQGTSYHLEARSSFGALVAESTSFPVK